MARGTDMGYDKPHPNSILGKARLQGDQETMAKVTAGRKGQDDDAKVVEAWAEDDFQSHPDRDQRDEAIHTPDGKQVSRRSFVTEDLVNEATPE